MILRNCTLRDVYTNVFTSSIYINVCQNHHFFNVSTLFLQPLGFKTKSSKFPPQNKNQMLANTNHYTTNSVYVFNYVFIALDHMFSNI